MSAHEAQTAALEALVSILKDKDVKTEVRLEAAKVILNRPRFFVGPDSTEK